jgi:phosphoenolpyruvate synthase/pyruvate phosphate dikinase
MSYIHIFTDGVDKLLSASIWFTWWGGADSFCFYQNNSLKGYINEDEFKKLGVVGKEILRDRDFMQALFSDSQKLTEQVIELENELKKTQEYNLELLAKLSTLLKECYKNYFYSEEYYTDDLDIVVDRDIVEKIGRYRLEFLKTCISATNITHDIAHKVVKDVNPEFLMINEILSENMPENSTEREKAFLLLQRDHKLKLYSGVEAEEMYRNLSQTKAQSEKFISGMGASRGKATGPVYKVSLTSDKLHELIDSMPKGSVLVTESTQPQIVLACKKAVAIVANEGGVLSHAAIISRELGIPCVVGTRNGTDILKNGQQVFVDGEKGLVTVVE